MTYAMLDITEETIRFVGICVNLCLIVHLNGTVK